jgi:hypothetical protein
VKRAAVSTTRKVHADFQSFKLKFKKRRYFVAPNPATKKRLLFSCLANV